MSGDFQLLQERIDEWLRWDRNPHTLQEVHQLRDEGKHDHLRAMLMERITFGTAGLRGRMMAGFAGMNELVVVQTAQGLLKHLEDVEGKLLRRKGIVVGYDGRHNSKRFAELTATIFLNANYPVQLFSTVVPTPFVPFTVAQLKTAVGIMVTASHNPKQDNGYKVYGSNGCQIVSPTDKNIQKRILENLEPWPNSWKTDVLTDNALIRDPLAQICAEYVKVVAGQIVNEHKRINAQTDLKFTYTAMHGVGYNYIVELFKAANLSVIAVEEQRDPDPEFPTVIFPNPEEGKSSLDLAMKKADASDCSVILANDPDADRLAVAEKNLSNGQWKIFNGNELGALLGWWCLHCYQSSNPNDNLHDCYFLSSTVSSKILKSMGHAEGVNFIETLTGFKWMGNQSFDLLNQGKQVIFAFEEAIGFMCGSTVLDKDGISAALHMATLAAYLHHHNLTLSQQLEEIYNEYGYHVSHNSYFICHDQAKIKSIFERLRNFTGPNTYPTGIMKNKYKIRNVRDLTTGFDDSQPDKRATLPVSKSSQMITFAFENGFVGTLRTSGTEPKIKYYTELCASPTQKNQNEIEALLNEMVTALVDEFFEPRKNGLTPKID